MKIGIITFLHNGNYGSTLQAWALQHVLREAGHDAFHLDYAPDTKEKIINLVSSGNSPALLLDGLRKRRVLAGEDGARRKAASFRDFYAAHMKLSVPCHNRAELASASKNAELLISGSDQIWSPVWFNPAYYLDFAAPEQKRIAYAASFGVASCGNAAKRRRIRGLTGAYQAVSVREQEGEALFSEITGRRTQVMPDPVCLITREEWMKLAAPFRAVKPYIACYLIGDRPDYWTQLAALKQRTGLDVVVIPVTQSAYEQPYTKADGLSPEDWLGVLAGASHVFTDSFHGTVFSLLLGRTVTVLRRYRDDDPESKNSRIDSLFGLLGLGDRQTVDPSPKIGAGLAAMRKQGLDWLLEQISEAAT